MASPRKIARRVAFPSTWVGHRAGMRIRRHHESEGRPEPAWVSGKPVWSVVHIEAPRASELAHVTDEHDELDGYAEHLPHAAA